MAALIATLPLAASCVALALRVTAWRSAALGLVVCLALIPLAFPTPVPALGHSLLGWMPTLLAVVLILGGGVLLSRLLDGSGAQQRLASALSSMVASPTAALLLVVHGAVPFAESVTGFGIGVMVGVPLLLHLGRTPMRAAVLSMLGLVTVPWGSLGPGTLIAARMNDLDLTEFGIVCAVVNGVVFLVSGVAVVIVDGGATPRRLAAGLASGAALWAAVWAANVLVGTPLAGVLGSLTIIGAHLLAGRLRGRRVVEPAGLVRALVPYTVLVTGLLLATGLTQLHPFAGLSGLLDSPALWLPITCVVAAVVLRFDAGRREATIRDALGTWPVVAVPTAGFLLLGVLMAATGMSTALAQAASALGHGYVALSPWIGGLGGFVTGSNTGANSMFATAQGETARALGVSVLHLVAMQNTAAAALTMAAPSRVLMALALCPADARPDRRQVMLVVLTANAVMLASFSVLALVTL